MNKEDNEEKEGFDFPINFESIIPSFLENINLFRLTFTPLELYTLKFFLTELRPINIREVYSFALKTIFYFVFSKNKIPQFQKFEKNLINAGYGTTMIDEHNREQTFEMVMSEIDGKSETEQERVYYRILRENKIKVPSYEKFKRIFKRLEELGIIYKNKNKEKPIYYSLNPKFYTTFKDKINDIINLQ